VQSDQANHLAGRPYFCGHIRSCHHAHRFLLRLSAPTISRYQWGGGRKGESEDGWEGRKRHGLIISIVLDKSLYESRWSCCNGICEIRVQFTIKAIIHFTWHTLAAVRDRLSICPSIHPSIYPDNGCPAGGVHDNSRTSTSALCYLLIYCFDPSNKRGEEFYL